jgi:hypothetical protein
MDQLRSRNTRKDLVATVSLSVAIRQSVVPQSTKPAPCVRGVFPSGDGFPVTEGHEK